jgi:lysozyme family protein
VNSSAYGRPTVAAKLAQIVVGVTPDGFIGDKSVAAINGYHPELFLAQYALAKVARYRDICMKNRSQTAFLLGWVNRVLKESV